MSTPFEEFVAEHAHSLARVAYLLTGHPGEAEDLVQEALLLTYRKWDQVSRAAHPSAYVRRMLTNQFLSERRRRRLSTRPLSSIEGTDWVAPDHADAAAASDPLWKAIGGLTGRQRAAVVLRYYCDLPDRDIAAHLGTRESTVRSLISRALTSLRDSPHLEAARPTNGRSS